MTGYKQYNTLLNQWEYYDSTGNSNGYQIQQPQSNINLDVVQKTLGSKQSKYNANLQRIKDEIQQSTMYIYACSKSKGYSYEEGKRSVTEFDVSYVDKIRYGKYDLSYDTVTNDLIAFLSKGALKIACDNFKDCN
ncbi:hypothetical protein GCM10011518_04610 [Flavobacterium limi]|uniref:Lipoprotein n=2 Tax=Flavobacterium limi TaxID=2045105 RepID=A0ABQ1TL59_9FLAO|nr:hypothetical protein GCM10011518_04610 [Flavobacterium limi]